MKGLQQVANILVVVGALNWGLVGLFNYNLVESLLGGLGIVNIVYILYAFPEPTTKGNLNLFTSNVGGAFLVKKSRARSTFSSRFMI